LQDARAFPRPPVKTTSPTAPNTRALERFNAVAPQRTQGNGKRVDRRHHRFGQRRKRPQESDGHLLNPESRYGRMGHIWHCRGRIIYANAIGSADNSQAMFDSVFCYFPITFRPPPDDPYGITAQDLKTRLRDCIASSGHFAPYAFPQLIDKLDSTSPNVKVRNSVSRKA